MRSIRIAVVDDDCVWLNSISNFLKCENDFSVVWLATNQEDAIRKSKETEVDIILMDINLSENKYDGIDAAQEIFQTVKTKIIMLTSLKGDDIICNSYSAGAVNFISKENYIEIPGLIRIICNGQSTIEIVLEEFRRLKQLERIKDLSRTESELYELLKEGYTPSQIQKMQFKSPQTIKNQINSMLKKLGVKNCKEAVTKNITKGLG